MIWAHLFYSNIMKIIECDLHLKYNLLELKIE